MPNTNLATGEIKTQFAKVNPKVRQPLVTKNRAWRPFLTAVDSPASAGRLSYAGALRFQRVWPSGQLSCQVGFEQAMSLATFHMLLSTFHHLPHTTCHLSLACHDAVYLANVCGDNQC